MGSAGHDERATADQARTEQGGCLGVAVGGGDSKAKAMICDGVIGVSAIDLIAREAGLIAQVFPPRSAIPTRATRKAEPRDCEVIPLKQMAAGIGIKGIARLSDPLEWRRC